MVKLVEEEVRPVSVSEAYHLLAPLKPRFKNPRSTAYQIFAKTLEYVEMCNRIQDISAIEDLKTTLNILGFTPEESSAMGSLLPQNSDEAKICIPSLNRLEDNVILQAIEKIQSLS
jgi:hypothetical protein